MANKTITILGIETSCDETAAALLQLATNNQQLTTFKILSNVVSSQVKIHAKYGGIVPEVAARKHAENIVPVLEECLANMHEYTTNNTNKKFVKIRGQISDYSRLVDAIAVTSGPGLITSLLIGVEAAKTLAFLTKKPLIPVNHLAAHIYSNFIGNCPALAGSRPGGEKLEIGNFLPAVCLVVSGGHTELVLMSRPKSGPIEIGLRLCGWRSRQGSGKEFCQFKKIGQTLDDAAGECFDKVAKILGLGYPGGPAIAAIANQHKSTTNFTNKKNSRKFVSKLVNIRDIKLPRPMINSPDFNFSFSGLKTAVLYKFQENKNLIKKNLSAFCREVQQAIIDVLIEKTLRAAKQFKAKSIILGGGVVANDELRKQFQSKVYSLLFKVKFFAPTKNLCTDNAAMIAAAGYFKLIKTPKKLWRKKFDWRKIKTDPNLEI